MTQHADQADGRTDTVPAIRPEAVDDAVPRSISLWIIAQPITIDVH